MTKNLTPQVDVFEILRFAQDDNLIDYFTFDTPSHLFIYPMYRRRLNNPQIIILALLWAAICYIILTGSEQIDGPLILSIVISGALVFIPLIKNIKNRGK